MAPINTARCRNWVRSTGGIDLAMNSAGSTSRKVTGAYDRRSQGQEAQASLADFCAIARSQLAELASLTTLDASSSIIRTPSFGSGRRLQPFSRRKVKQATKAVRLLPSTKACAFAIPKA